MSQLIGPTIADLMGYEITAEERELLQHPLLGGIILFTRNYESPAQIADLCHSIRQIRPSLLIAVDQEGGRVQRFKEGFIRLPSMGEIGKVYQYSSEDALQWAYTSGWLMAAELLSVGVDFSFAPVLDLAKEENTAIGNRSFNSCPQIVSLLAQAIMNGMHAAGMIATGKHFPGHGSVKVDSHVALPVDERNFKEIYQEDMQPFIRLIAAGIDAIMPAHILFPAVDEKPVGFSRYWLQKILRQQLNFSGVIFSDDLNMQGAEAAGNYSSRATAALEAGCDFVLLCNNRQGAIEILDSLSEKYCLMPQKFSVLQGKPFFQSLVALRSSTTWKTIVNKFNQYEELYANH